jgi:hypothetical protein
MKRKIDYKDQLPTYKQLEGIINRKDIILGDSATIIKESKVLDVSWEEAEIVYNSYSPEERRDIKKSGQQLMSGYYNPITKQVSNPGENPSDARGIMVTQMYLNQNKCCAYSKDGPYHILDFQVEHINQELGDVPENIVLVLANINENKKQSVENFISRCQKRYDMGELEYNIWYKSMKDSMKKNHHTKAKILSMTEDELRDYWQNKTTTKYNKYVWRNIGMSSLSEFRILKKSGIKRSGGTQGNYAAILNTIAAEYLYGDKHLASEIYKCARMFRSNYLNGQIQREDYAMFNIEIIELSNHIYSLYNREKFYNSIVRNNYSWPHLN